MEDKTKTPKKAQAELVNKIRGEALSIFFQLEVFSEHDSGGVAQSRIVEFMEDLTAITRNILKKDGTE